MAIHFKSGLQALNLQLFYTLAQGRGSKMAKDFTAFHPEAVAETTSSFELSTTDIHCKDAHRSKDMTPWQWQAVSPQPHTS